MKPNPHARYRKEAWLKLLVTVGSIVIFSFVLSSLGIRLDLTEDNRYTLSEPSKEILGTLKNDIYVQVYLDGDMPVPLKRLRRSVLELLEEFRIASDRKIDYSIINPSRGENDSQRNAMYESLMNKGLTPTRLQAEDKEGGSSQKIIFPGLIINYNGIEVPLNFLRNNPALSPEQNILRASEALEYEIVQIISTLSSDTVTRIAFIEGHGELPEIETADITYNLAKFFTVDRGAIGGKPGSLDRYSAVVIAGPTREFNEADKFVIDQYIMNGGKVLWLLEEVFVNSDSLSLGETAALYRPLEIEDQLFRYGARVNPELVQDLNSQFIRVKVIDSKGNQQLVPFPWVYYPLLAGSARHPVTRNLNRVKGEFVNYIDTVGLDTAVRKEVLLATSEYTRTVNPPLLIRLSEAERLPDESAFTRKRLPVAVLLEGRFTSAFRNRMTEAFLEEKVKVVDRSPETKMIVVADADIIRNGIRRTAAGESPLPLGLDRYTGEIYGNTDFILNCLNYLVDDKDLLQLRSRELKIRLLDKARIRRERIIWQVINTTGPIILIITAGLVFGFFRKKKYS